MGRPMEEYLGVGKLLFVSFVCFCSNFSVRKGNGQRNDGQRNKLSFAFSHSSVNHSSVKIFSRMKDFDGLQCREKTLPKMKRFRHLHCKDANEEGESGSLNPRSLLARSPTRKTLFAASRLRAFALNSPCMVTAKRTTK